MATSNFSLVDIQDDEDQEIDLQFQDFGSTETSRTEASKSSNVNNQAYFSSFNDNQEDTDKLLGDDDAEVETSTKSLQSFWTFEYYQQFFNVESKQVADRIVWSMIPKPGVNYLQTYIRPNPDLYGPFWICVTLIFTTSITGNLANYLQSHDPTKWKYEFHKVTLATTSIFSYAWLVPLLIWGLLVGRGSKTLSLLDLLCLYGYSLAVFVPVSLLWMIPLKWLQWCLGIVGSVLSGGVLVRTVMPALSHESKRTATVIAAIIMILHAALALGFMLYFFYPPTDTVTPNTQAEILTQKIPEAQVDAMKLAEKNLAVGAGGVAMNQTVNKVKNAKVENLTKRDNNVINSVINKIDSQNSENNEIDSPNSLKKDIGIQNPVNNEIGSQNSIKNGNLMMNKPMTSIADKLESSAKSSVLNKNPEGNVFAKTAVNNDAKPNETKIQKRQIGAIKYGYQPLAGGLEMKLPISKNSLT